MLPEGFYRCPACGRTYRSASVPDKCLVCGAGSADQARATDNGIAQPDAVTDKFRLAASRAKGFF